MARAKIMLGNDRKRSITLEMMSSDRPPKYPAMPPRAMPQIRANATTEMAMVNEVVAPYKSRLKMSLPRWSVPSQCSFEGDCRLSFRLISLGSYGAIQGARMAMMTMAARRTRQTATVRLAIIRWQGVHLILPRMAGFDFEILMHFMIIRT